MSNAIILLNFGEPEEATLETVTPFLERIFNLNRDLERHADAAAAELTEARAERDRARDAAEPPSPTVGGCLRGQSPGRRRRAGDAPPARLQHSLHQLLDLRVVGADNIMIFGLTAEEVAAHPRDPAHRHRRPLRPVVGQRPPALGRVVDVVPAHAIHAAGRSQRRQQLDGLRRHAVLSLQEHLLPSQLPVTDQWDLSASYEVGDPMLDVGGESYEIFRLAPLQERFDVAL